MSSRKAAMRNGRLTGLVALAFTAGLNVATASAQVPMPRPPLPRPPVMVGVDPVKADFLARTGSDTVYFAGTGHTLDASARATLVAQAAWLRLNPMVRVRIEGHTDQSDSRDHALAVGERRAEVVRDFLVLNGVPAAQVTAISLGKERPATMGTGPAVAALNRRAVTVLTR